MTTYRLYLDHGPKRRKTMVHVMDLMGCVTNGPTTDEALASTPGEIGSFISFLADHGDPVDPDEPFDTEIAEEITQGQWLGNGIQVFGPDRDPLSSEELGSLLDRYDWIHEALLDHVAELDPAELRAVPEKGRAVGAIIEHVLGSDAAYLASGLASNRTLNRLARDVGAGAIDPREALAEGGRLFAADMRAAMPDQLAAVIPRGQSIGSARRTMRRALEHGWEHLREIEVRLV
jgi:predicted RNase H-like HicB family nuclease